MSDEQNQALEQNYNYLNALNNSYNTAYNQMMGYYIPVYNNTNQGNNEAQAQYADNWTQYAYDQAQNQQMMRNTSNGAAAGALI